MKRRTPKDLRAYRIKRRKKDWFMYIFLKDFNFERMNPEE
jgi:hypothetical protein